jgi:beta-galactosidase
MFDFGADARNEGGENGQNHKGLMTFDRKYKKDAFYAYKAWLSDEPFVHVCGKRYVDRVEDVTKVTVYSNLPEVELFANGESLGKKSSSEHFFYFDVPNNGETKLLAVAGDCKDESVIKKVDTFNEEYRLKEKGAILNWFDVTAPEGYFSINDKLSDIFESKRGKLVVALFGYKLLKKMKANKKGKNDEKKSGGFDLNFKAMKGSMMQMLGGFSILRMSSMIGMANITVTKEELLKVNAQLNKVKRPKK